MRATIMRAPGNVVVTEVDHPKIIEPTDAIIELAAACICGSDLWPYRGYDKAENRAMGHEYVGTVVEVGSDVTTVKPGDFVVGSFCISDNTCEICDSGYQSRCVNGGFVSGTQAEFVRIPQADGTLVVVPGGRPTDPDVLASLLAASDVLGTGWFGAVAAEAGPGKTVAVVGDGAVGLLAILAAKELGAERVIAMSRNPQRQAVRGHRHRRGTRRGGYLPREGPHQRAGRAQHRRGGRHPAVHGAGHRGLPPGWARRFRRGLPRREPAGWPAVRHRGAPAWRARSRSPFPAGPD